MKKLAKVPLYVLGAGAAAFVGTFTMYMFNLDMKLMTVIEPLLAKWYDSREHDFYLLFKKRACRAGSLFALS